MPLPVAIEVNRLLEPQRQLGDVLDLLAVRHETVIFAPCGFLSEAQQIRTADVVMLVSRDAGVRSAFHPIRAGAVEAVSPLVVNRLRTS